MWYNSVAQEEIFNKSGFGFTPVISYYERVLPMID
jgi:hypothetical protein